MWRRGMEALICVYAIKYWHTRPLGYLLWEDKELQLPVDQFMLVCI